ncbi:adenylosuccinate synthetase [Defluviimonas salinarum]|uniref:Adenylosuccinate synthetase n=1 Tax=Defluviimonas salinarum TaxID=2992147 RepID=A0ABT3J465_9RHOB|nr:adenylosuccinate synthetase [Defluviimonas salinarum]MCW3782480.1 adenylosuccinate synthetase [Defluviimonas salinarum]
MAAILAHAIIGAGWGDEGKGLATDALAARLAGEGREVTVVRSNGGAQAGHGVALADGRRHVFHHVGSGSFAGAASHLSRFFVAHPMMLGREIDALDALGARPTRITIDPRAIVTTPWDMAINQAVEMARGGARHGSCGLGFGEAIERHENGFALTAGDIRRPGLRSRLERIRDEWLPARLARLGLDAGASPLRDVLLGRTDLVAPFLADCACFAAAVDLLDDAALGRHGAVIFEGAQGLRLDMEFGEFPHVTRSHTGIRNMLAIAAEAGIGEIRPLYMTRAYATRHGAGPLPHELPEAMAAGRLPWAEVVDLTNAPNAWQGTLRFAPLDVTGLGAIIARDIALAQGSGIRVIPAVGLTCIDQIRGCARIVEAGREIEVTADALTTAVEAATGLPVRLLSKGPTRNTAGLALGDEPSFGRQREIRLKAEIDRREAERALSRLRARAARGDGLSVSEEAWLKRADRIEAARPEPDGLGPEMA